MAIQHSDRLRGYFLVGTMPVIDMIIVRALPERHHRELRTDDIDVELGDV